jgi:hypothetical protein
MAGLGQAPPNQFRHGRFVLDDQPPRDPPFHRLRDPPVAISRAIARRDSKGGGSPTIPTIW